MRCFAKWTFGILLMIGSSKGMSAIAQDRYPSEFTPIIADALNQGDSVHEPNYHGKPLSYWLGVIRDRDDDMMAQALDAIRSLGPAASVAVPDLTDLVAAPFTPIRIGVDSDDSIADKLYDIEIRSAAIDALASIGKASTPATVSVIEWALMPRVVPAPGNSAIEDELFVDFATLEVGYRIRVIDAIQQFGESALSETAKLLLSSNPEKRKFAVVILGTDVLPIAAELLKSSDCEHQRLGLTILGDLAPLISKAYLAQLSEIIVCTDLAQESTK